MNRKDIQSLEKVRKILSNVPYSIDICTAIMIIDNLIREKDNQVKKESNQWKEIELEQEYYPSRN